MALDTKLHLFTLLLISLKCILAVSSYSCSSMTCPLPALCKDGRCLCRDGFVAVNCTDSTQACFCPSEGACNSSTCNCTENTFACTQLPRCEENLNVTCNFNGTCVVKDTKPYCICPSTISDTEDCTPNPCDKNPCSSGKCISRGIDDFDCICSHGGVGTECSLEEKCTDKFCANGGTCYEYDYKYAKCRCRGGYDGQRCEHSLAAEKCDGFGTESSTTNITTNETICTCKVNFKGKLCNEVDCELLNPCNNGGLCYSDPTSFNRVFCLCPKGWTNDKCDVDIDQCADSPCGSGGTCTDLKGNFSCHCADNTTGMFCHSAGDNCLDRKYCMMVAKDGTCNANCNNVYCDFDGGDCILADPWDACGEPPGYCGSLAGNGVCDQDCNNEQCLFDLSDCNPVSSTTCPQNCIDTWGDGECQSACNNVYCGYDGSDCTTLSEKTKLGHIVMEYSSKSPSAYKTLGRILTMYTGAMFSLKEVTKQNEGQQFQPFGLSLRNMTSRHIVFFLVSNSDRCPSNDTLCWNNTEALSKFTAALFIKKSNIFLHDGEPVTIINVKECMPGHYGPNCDLHCGHCNNTTQCDLATGTCPNGCMEGYWGQKCDKLCNTNCLDGCEDVDGNCTDGNCNNGYHGAKCSEKCPPGTYGLACAYNCSVNCNDECDNVNGTCLCTVGHKGPRCEMDCENGTYGKDCSGVCGQCLDSLPCDKKDGSCSDGCISGYIGMTCDSVCPIGKYGKACSNLCSNCANNNCNPGTGVCKTGCKQGWIGDTCMAESLEDAGANNSTIIAVIIVMAILIVAGILLAICLWKKKQSGDYICDEKGSDIINMKNLKGVDGNSNGEVEPLVAVSTNDKNFPNAKLVIENDGTNSNEEQKDEPEPETESERSSKNSDFRPESIHGNGPGGVYVGSKGPVDGSSKERSSSRESEVSKNSHSGDGDVFRDEANLNANNTDTSENDDISKNEQSSGTDETRITSTTKDDDGVIKTDNL